MLAISIFFGCCASSAFDASTDGVNYNRIATKSDDQLANSDGDTLSLQGNASLYKSDCNQHYNNILSNN